MDSSDGSSYQGAKLADEDIGGNRYNTVVSFGSGSFPK